MSGITWNNLSSYNWGLFSLTSSSLIRILICRRFFLRLNNILLNVCTIFYLFIQFSGHTQVTVTRSLFWVYSYEHGREKSLKSCFEWSGIAGSRDNSIFVILRSHRGHIIPHSHQQCTCSIFSQVLLTFVNISYFSYLKFCSPNCYWTLSH